MECDCSMSIYLVGIFCTIAGIICGVLLSIVLIVKDKITCSEVKLWIQEF